jgi:hypothetical protein
MKFTKKQILFLVIYPLVHTGLSIVFLLMAISKGLFQDDPNWHPTQTQVITSAIGGFLICILWAPLFMIAKLGIRPHQTFWEYFSIYLCGVLYAFIAVMIYKRIKQGSRCTNLKD